MTTTETTYGHEAPTNTFQDQALTLKADLRNRTDQILANTKLTDQAKHDEITTLREKTRTQLAQVQAAQQQSNQTRAAELTSRLLNRNR